MMQTFTAVIQKEEDMYVADAQKLAQSAKERV